MHFTWLKLDYSFSLIQLIYTKTDHKFLERNLIQWNENKNIDRLYRNSQEEKKTFIVYRFAKQNLDKFSYNALQPMKTHTHTRRM